MMLFKQYQHTCELFVMMKYKIKLKRVAVNLQLKRDVSETRCWQCTEHTVLLYCCFCVVFPFTMTHLFYHPSLLLLLLLLHPIIYHSNISLYSIVFNSTTIGYVPSQLLKSFAFHTLVLYVLLHFFSITITLLQILITREITSHC